MAKQKGPIKIVGTLGDLTFAKTRHGYLVKEKTSVDAHRIATDPHFQRTRENAKEFSNAGKAGKLLTKAFRAAILGTTDADMRNRLLSLMFSVLKTDQVHDRGFRTVAAGDMQLLKDFQFNADAPLDTTFNSLFTPSIDRVTGDIKVVIPSYVPTTMIVAPQGASHYRLVVAGAEIDFDAGVQLPDITPSAYLPWNKTATAPLTLTATVTPASTLPLFLVFGIEFYQEVNATKYPLNNGSYNTFAVQMIDA